MDDITYAVSVDVNNPIIPYNVYVASVLDSNVRYLEITLYQNGNVIALSNTATATASLVTDNVLVNDSVNCTIQDNIITVPLEDLQRHGNLDVQVTVTEGTKVLAIPFPIQVRVTPNIVENAQIDENSLGSYAEVVHEIAEARGTYTTLHDAIENLEAIPYSVKLAMDTLFSKAAYADDDAASSYATFHAWVISNLVTFITAVFTQGSATIHDTDSLDTLKQYLTVTATYSDSTAATVTDYTLSGTLTKGTSTITVSYGGKTTTFSVTVTETARILVESGKKASFTTGLLETTDEEVSVTSIIPVSDSTVSHAVGVKVNGSIVNTLIRAYDQNGMFYASTGGWETLQSVPSAINFAGFRILLQCVVSSTDEIVAIIDNEEYPVYIGVVEDYSNTVNVLAKITDYSAAEGESEGSNYVLTDFIPINPTSGTDQTAVYNFVTDSNLNILVYQLTDDSDTPISTRIGNFNSNSASGKPESGVTRFRIIFAKRDQSDFTSAELANISLVNNDMVIFALTERR